MARTRVILPGSGVALARWLARLVLLVVALLIALAAEGRAQSQPAFRLAVAGAIEGAIVPGYTALAEAAALQRQAMERLCAAPSAPALTEARAAFGDLVRAFARVEPYRFGPAREDNRFERLFFWPDPRGRGLRQVQALLAEKDPAAVDAERLRDKSVAVQGLPALDFVLAGSGSDALAAPPAGFRCRYGLAVAGAVATTAGEMRAGWRGPDGFAATMLSAGPENPVYRSHGEAAQDLLQAASEQLQLLRDLKLAPILGDAPADARPRRAPFWRSGLALAAMEGNVEAVAALAGAADLESLLPPGEEGLAGTLSFELRQAVAVLSTFPDDPRPLAAIVSDPAAHERLSYAMIPLGGAIALLDGRIPAALGLVAGFNALDGD